MKQESSEKNFLKKVSEVFEKYDNGDETRGLVLREINPQIVKIAMYKYKIYVDYKKNKEDFYQEIYMKIYEGVTKTEPNRTFNQRKKTLFLSALFAMRKFFLSDVQGDRGGNGALPRRCRDAGQAVDIVFVQSENLYEYINDVDEGFIKEYINMSMASRLSVVEQIVINSIFFLGITNEKKLVETINKNDLIASFFKTKLSWFKIKKIKIKALSKLKSAFDEEDGRSFGKKIIVDNPLTER